MSYSMQLHSPSNYHHIDYLGDPLSGVYAEVEVKFEAPSNRVIPTAFNPQTGFNMYGNLCAIYNYPLNEGMRYLANRKDGGQHVFAWYYEAGDDSDFSAISKNTHGPLPAPGSSKIVYEIEVGEGNPANSDTYQWASVELIEVEGGWAYTEADGYAPDEVSPLYEFTTLVHYRHLTDNDLGITTKQGVVWTNDGFIGSYRLEGGVMTRSEFVGVPAAPGSRCTVVVDFDLAQIGFYVNGSDTPQYVLPFNPEVEYALAVNLEFDPNATGITHTLRLGTERMAIGNQSVFPARNDFGAPYHTQTWSRPIQTPPMKLTIRDLDGNDVPHQYPAVLLSDSYLARESVNNTARFCFTRADLKSGTLAGGPDGSVPFTLGALIVEHPPYPWVADDPYSPTMKITHVKMCDSYPEDAFEARKLDWASSGTAYEDVLLDPYGRQCRIYSYEVTQGDLDLYASNSPLLLEFLVQGENGVRTKLTVFDQSMNRVAWSSPDLAVGSSCVLEHPTPTKGFVMIEAAPEDLAPTLDPNMTLVIRIPG